ncbi:MAG: hypothetical protein II792_09985 [Prevotella sp.]|nr:hypothetical protein [Prevotella sp.]
MTTVLRQPLKAVLGMLLLLLAACGESHQQMVLQLEELERQNRADSLMLNDTLALRLADYFDRHGSANERLRAHYILGRTYADMGEAPAALSAYLDAADCADTTQADCDYQTLYKAYAQMATIFHKQNLPQDEIIALNKYSQYVRMDNPTDTTRYLVARRQMVRPYFLLGEKDSVLEIIEQSTKQLLGIGSRQEAARGLLTAIYIYTERGQLHKANELLTTFERESNLFDAKGNIAKGREDYYWIKGNLELAKGNMETADSFFRKGILYGSYEAVSSSYKGMLSIFHHKRDIDSIARYSRLNEYALDSLHKRIQTDAIHQTSALYNYSRYQTIANREHQRAKNEGDKKNILIVIVLSIFILAIALLAAWRKRRKQILLKYERNMEELQRANADLNNLHALEAEKTDLQALSDELYRQIAAKEAAVGHLQREIAQLRRENVPQVSVAEQQLSQSDLYRRLHQSAKCEAIPEEEWQAIDAMVRNTLPGYHRFLSSLRYSPDSNEYRICLLLRLHIRMQDASGFIGISKSYVSRMSSTILDEVFALKGSGKELQKQLERIS